MNREQRRAAQKKQKKIEKQEMRKLVSRVKDAQKRFLKTGRTDYQDGELLKNKEGIGTYVQQTGRKCVCCKKELSTTLEKDKLEVMFCQECKQSPKLAEFLIDYLNEMKDPTIIKEPDEGN